MPKVFTLLRNLQHDLPSGRRRSTSRDHNLRVHSIRVQGVDSGFSPSGLDILFGVCMSMSSTVELPESSLDDCGASFSDVIVCSLIDNSEHLSCPILSYPWWPSPSPTDNLCLRRYANNETLLIHIEDVFWFKAVLTNQLRQLLEVVS